MTLKEAIEARHCRKGKAEGTTKDGAYWCAGDVLIRGFGSDGVGNNAPDLRMYLDLRHYRDGAVRAVLQLNSWHQNHGDRNRYLHVNELLTCVTAEQVIVKLKGTSMNGEAVYSDRFKRDLIALLASFGLPEDEPAPDEVAAEA